MTEAPSESDEDDCEDAPQGGPIAEAVAAKITKDHIDKFLGMMERLVASWGERGHRTSRFRIVANYVLLGFVLAVLAYLNLRGTLPGEALAGFMGTAIGYWLGTANQNWR